VRGVALPSLPTVCYIAERLNVPVGFLLSEEREELAYRKMSAMPNIRRALLAGDHAGCLSIIRATFGDERDDEIALIRAECEFCMAKEAFEHGRLRAAAVGFDRALAAAKQTVYDTGWIVTRAAVYFRYLSGISPTVSSDMLEESEILCARSLEDEFCAYVMAKEALEAERTGEVADYLAQCGDTVYAARLSALLKMRAGDIGKALLLYERLLAREDLSVGVLMYEIFGDMELCCRRNDDYKRAYEFSSSRIGLLERLLEEA